MIIAGPSPLDDVAGSDGHGAGAEIGTPLSDGNIRRRRGSEDGTEEDEKEEQPEMHQGGSAIFSAFLARRLARLVDARQKTGDCGNHRKLELGAGTCFSISPPLVAAIKWHATGSR